MELNTTFYHFPRATTVEKWKKLGGKNFIWAVKAWRWLTHVKKLKQIKGDTLEFLERIAPLVSKGVVLFQLPPNLKQDLRRLEDFLKILPKEIRFAIEFRNNSWFVQETYELLKESKVSLVGVDAPGIQRVLDVRTAPFFYLRVHGTTHWYSHNYSKKELKIFADAAKTHLKKGDVFVYFDNTAGGNAFRNALSFRDFFK